MTYFPRSATALTIIGLAFSSTVIAPAAAAEPKVEVVNAGSGQKAELRFAPKKGLTESFEVQLDLETTMNMGGPGAMPINLPPLVLTLTGTVTDVESNGNIHYTYELTKSTTLEKEGIDKTLKGAMEAETAKLVGMKGEVVMSPIGQRLSSKILPPPGAGEEQVDRMKQSMNHAAVPLPTEPVGVGAVWRVTQVVKENGLTLDQTNTYTLKEHTGSTIVLQTELTQQVGDGPAFNPDLPPGATADIASLTSQGSGETILALDHLFPTKATLDHKLDTLILVGQTGKKMNMALSMALKLQMHRP